jgi:hypothetical protein
MTSCQEIKTLELDLNSFNRETRKKSLAKLKESTCIEKNANSPEQAVYNLHCHTFCSYNGYGYSPSYIAWMAQQKAWFAAGIVDFDVLDGVEEFLGAAEKLNLRAVCGIETRAYVADLAQEEINSPGEPGVAYHMGVGFTSSALPTKQQEFLANLKIKANARTENIVKLVNAYLSPVEVNFKEATEKLTPFGNITERHVCTAYREKAEEVFSDKNALAEFWAEKLSLDTASATKLIADPVKLEGTIRSKTMKSGGVGYVQASPKSFPALQEMNDFTLACGAIPCIAWLDGMSDGEKNPDKLLDMHISHDAALLTIIPDRNWNFSDLEVKAAKIKCLDEVIAAATERDMPIVIGTEMNAPGQKLVDDFDCDALKKHHDIFIEGAAIAFAHTLLTPLKMGYLSEWAKENFKSKKEKNSFFAKIGRSVTIQKFVTIKDQLKNKSAREVIGLIAF